MVFQVQLVNLINNLRSDHCFGSSKTRRITGGTVTTPEIIDQIHELILEDHRTSVKSIAEQLGMSRERVGSIINEDLNMRKLSA